ncbi:MAG: RHS repeat-associated core domain-containing protein [Nitrospirae bacterium]|nr:RHS repeat-associated core domain-containing protein [Nitrospirota bacterium]
MKYIMSGTQIIAQISGSDTNYYHTDHLGSSSIITDNTGNKVEDIYYYPYGEIKTNTGSANVRYKYTGKEFDAEDGLYYYGARYYDPRLARFISADTIVPRPFYPQSLNRYAYAYNNPIILKDIDGHEPGDYWETWEYWYGDLNHNYYDCNNNSNSYGNSSNSDYSWSNNYSLGNYSLND